MPGGHTAAPLPKYPPNIGGTEQLLGVPKARLGVACRWSSSLGVGAGAEVWGEVLNLLEHLLDPKRRRGCT